MANFRRSRPALHTFSRRWEKRSRHPHAHLYGMSSWPAWHDILHFRRPHRRTTKAMEHAVLRGADPDDLAWPLVKRPHNYYW